MELLLYQLLILPGKILSQGFQLKTIHATSLQTDPLVSLLTNHIFSNNLYCCIQRLWKQEILDIGRRGLDIAGLPVKKHSFNAVNAHVESPMVRKPFSPISSTESPNPNAVNLLEDLSRRHNETLQKTIVTIPSYNTPFLLLPRSILLKENRTPKTMTMPVPSTPSTVSIPMQTNSHDSGSSINCLCCYSDQRDS